MAFVGRGGGGTGRYLEWKVRLFFVAAVLLLVGIAREIDLLVLLAIAVLAVAFALRFFERPVPAPSDEDDGDPGDDDEADHGHDGEVEDEVVEDETPPAGR
jgi:membrane protein implicated in regulation of membrane protease activity